MRLGITRLVRSCSAVGGTFFSADGIPLLALPAVIAPAFGFIHGIYRFKDGFGSFELLFELCGNLFMIDFI